MTALLQTDADIDFNPLILIDAHEAFTMGDCWLLAQAFNDLYGYRLGFYGIRSVATATGRDLYWIHCFAVLDDDTFIDINGIMTSEEMKMEWEDRLAEAYDPHAEGIIVIPTPEMATIYINGQTPMFPEYDPHEIAKLLHRSFLQ